MAINDTDYNSTLAVTDVVNSNTYAQATAVDNTGMSQGALYTLLNSIVTNWNLALVKVKADGANSTYSGSAVTTLALQGHGLTANGMHQVDLINTLKELETAMNAVLALLDADTQVTKTDYVATVNALGTGAALNLDDTVAGSYGLNQDKLVAFLSDFVTKFNGLLTHLDTDAL
jgi:hypothetical protein